MTDRKLTVKIDAKAAVVVSRSAILSPHSVAHMTVFVAIWICIEDNIPEFFKIQLIKFWIGFDLPIEI